MYIKDPYILNFSDKLRTFVYQSSFIVEIYKGIHIKVRTLKVSLYTGKNANTFC